MRYFKHKTLNKLYFLYKRKSTYLSLMPPQVTEQPDHSPQFETWQLMGQFGVHLGMFSISLLSLENSPSLQSCFSSHSPVQFAPPYAGEGFVQYLLRTINPPGPQSTEQVLHCCHSPKPPATKDGINFTGYSF